MSKRKIISPLFLIIILLSTFLAGCTDNGSDNNDGDSTTNFGEVNYDGYQLRPLESTEFIIDYTGISDGILIVTNGKTDEEVLYGGINMEGELVVPLQEAYYYDFKDGLAEALIREEDYYGMYYIDKTGEKVIEEVDGKKINVGTDFIDGYACIYFEGESENYVIDKKGNIVLTPKDQGYVYDNLGGGKFSRYTKDPDISRGFSSGKPPEGIVNVNGDFFPTDDIFTYGMNSEFNGFYSEDWNTYGIFDNEKLERITEPKFLKLGSFVDDLTLAVDVDGLVQIINSNGELMVDLSEKYNMKSISLVKVDGVEKYYDAKDVEVLELSEEYKNFIFDTIYLTFNSGVISLNFFDETGAMIIDNKGNLVAQTDYDYIGEFNDNLAICKKDGKYGYVDSTGKEVLAPTYQLVTSFYDGVGFVKDGEKQYRFAE